MRRENLFFFSSFFFAKISFISISIFVFFVMQLKLAENSIFLWLWVHTHENDKIDKLISSWQILRYSFNTTCSFVHFSTFQWQRMDSSKRKTKLIDTTTKKKWCWFVARHCYLLNVSSFYFIESHGFSQSLAI